MALPEHDEIHVVSDLHMGGEAGFQILAETGRLAAYIRWVTEQRPDGRVALVLNGDTIDTLAENICGYIAVDNAVAVVARIVGDTSFLPIWQALAEFVAKPGRELIFVLGNHDLELSFQPVQRMIADRLAGEDDAARGRILFSTMGGGYTCTVGGKRVYCTHGNEVDDWNFVEYEELAKAGRRLNCGRTVAKDDWQPNAGTKLVMDVMNDIKKSYRWIDLMKPEKRAALGVMLALDPKQLDKIGRILPIIGKLIEGSFEVDQRLSAEGVQRPAGHPPRPMSLDRLLGPSFREGVLGAQSGIPQEKELLLLAEQGYKTFNPEAEFDETTLGYGGYLWDRLTGWITGISKQEALRRALKDLLEKDHSFDITDKDDTCKDICAATGGSIDFIVTGHTHLHRAIKLSGGRLYFNSGTWIRLLRLTDAMLKDEAAFAPVYKILKKGDMESIDHEKPGGEPLVLDQCSAVRIWEEGGTARGGLFRITLGAGGTTIIPILVGP